MKVYRAFKVHISKTTLSEHTVMTPVDESLSSETKLLVRVRKNTNILYFFEL